MVPREFTARILLCNYLNRERATAQRFPWPEDFGRKALPVDLAVNIGPPSGDSLKCFRSTRQVIDRPGFEMKPGFFIGCSLLGMWQLAK
jgi:hypothetical protein